MTRDERDPIERASELPVPELGDDHPSSGRSEPEGGDPEAPEPELDRLDLTAEEPDDVELDVELTDDDQASGYSRG